jgi:DNA repair exonuclease SbcCD ATPase subunit
MKTRLFSTSIYGGDKVQEFEDKRLTCRECGKDFTFTVGEQEFYARKGISQPSRCRQCREDNRRQNSRLACSECGSELVNQAYCLTCVDNLKQEAEFKVHSEHNKVGDLESRLETLNELRGNLASATAEVDRSRETIRSLRQKIEPLEVENSKLAAELASRRDLEAVVRQLTEQFENLRESHTREIQELIQNCLDMRNALMHRQDGNLLHRLKLAFKGKHDSQTRVHEGKGVQTEVMLQRVAEGPSNEGEETSISGPESGN